MLFAIGNNYHPENTNIDMVRHEPVIDATTNNAVHYFKRGDVMHLNA